MPFVPLFGGVNCHPLRAFRIEPATRGPCVPHHTDGLSGLPLPSSSATGSQILLAENCRSPRFHFFSPISSASRHALAFQSSARAGVTTDTGSEAFSGSDSESIFPVGSELSFDCAGLTTTSTGTVNPLTPRSSVHGGASGSIEKELPSFSAH